MFEQVRQVVLNSGLWNGKQAETHRFVLTPTVFNVTKEKCVELLGLAKAICEALRGIDRMTMTALYNEHEEPIWMILKNALRTQVPKFDLDLLDVESGCGPRIFKFDVIEGMDERFYVPEIDTRVIQNWGVAILTERLQLVVAPEARRFLDMAIRIAEEFRRHGGASTDTLYLIYPDVERFYKPYFLILKSALAELNIRVDVLHENRAAQAVIGGRFFVDLPLCKLNLQLGETLARRYRDGQVKLLVPPKSHLGSKNILGIICNVDKDKDLENILRMYIPEGTLQLLRQYFPESRLVYSASSWEGVKQQYLLKEVISGGSKGVILGDTHGFAAKVEQARREPFGFILQKEVETLVRILPYFGSNGELKEGRFGVRLIIHANSVGEILNVSATASTNRRNIHGGKEALMYGTTIA